MEDAFSAADETDHAMQRDELQALILDHARNPEHFGSLPHANRIGTGHNPICGDRFQVFLEVREDRVEAIRFRGAGCAISMASASMMTGMVEGQSVPQAETLVDRLYHFLADGPRSDPDPLLDELVALSGVRAFPLRIKCATLPWSTLRAALQDQSNAVSTE